MFIPETFDMKLLKRCGCALSEKLNTFSKLVSSEITMQVWDIPWENFNIFLMFFAKSLSKRTQFSIFHYCDTLQFCIYLDGAFVYRECEELDFPS